MKLVSLSAEHSGYCVCEEPAGFGGGLLAFAMVSPSGWGGRDLECLSVQSRGSSRLDTQLWLLNGGRFLYGKVIPSAVCY